VLHNQVRITSAPAMQQNPIGFTKLQYTKNMGSSVLGVHATNLMSITV
jgi:hypothetical protein